MNLKRFFQITLTTALIAALNVSSATALGAGFGPMPPLEIAAVDRGYISPTGPVLALNYFNPPPQPWSAGFHRGVDMAAPLGSVIVAPSAGTVTFAGLAFGKPTITISHPDGLISSLEPVAAAMMVENPLYVERLVSAGTGTAKSGGSSGSELVQPQFIEKILARVGDTVSAGTPIGVLGNWPAASGSNASHCPDTTCVHWGVRRSEDNYVDPLWLLGLAAPIIFFPAG